MYFANSIIPGIRNYRGGYSITCFCRLHDAAESIGSRLVSCHSTIYIKYKVLIIPGLLSHTGYQLVALLYYSHSLFFLEKGGAS